MSKFSEILKMPWAENEYYCFWLAQSYYYIRNSTRLLASAAANFDVDRQDLFNRFVSHLREENGHEKLAELATNYLQSENNGERVERIIRDNKVFDVLKKEVKLDMIEMPYLEFVDKVNEKTQHEVEHHH